MPVVALVNSACEAPSPEPKAKAKAKVSPSASAGSSNDNYPIFVKFSNDTTSYELIIDKTTITFIINDNKLVLLSSKNEASFIFHFVLL